MSDELDRPTAKYPATHWLGSDFQAPPRTPGGVALCGACRKQQACRLGLVSERLEAPDMARFELRCPTDHEGGPGVAHGGWTAAAFDECLGHLPLLHGVMSVTAELSISFIKPVPIEQPLEVRAWVERREGSRWYIRAEMTLLPGHALLGKASGIWVVRDRNHFARFEKWLEEQGSAPAGDAPSPPR